MSDNDVLFYLYHKYKEEYINPNRINQEEYKKYLTKNNLEIIEDTTDKDKNMYCRYCKTYYTNIEFNEHLNLMNNSYRCSNPLPPPPKEDKELIIT